MKVLSVSLIPGPSPEGGDDRVACRDFHDARVSVPDDEKSSESEDSDSKDKKSDKDEPVEGEVVDEK